MCAKGGWGGRPSSGGGGATGWHRNEGCTIKSQMGGGGNGVNGRVGAWYLHEWQCPELVSYMTGQCPLLGTYMSRQCPELGT